MSSPPCSSNKKARLNDDDDSDSAAAVDKLLKQFDVNKVTGVARTNDSVLEQLTNFAQDLNQKVEEVRKARQAEIQEAAVNRAKAIQQQIQDQKNQLLKSNSCFECKKAVDILSLCKCFIEHGVQGDGLSLCEDCAEEKFKGTCSECDNFLCENCESFTCKSCGEVACLHCMEADKSEWVHCCEVYCGACSEGSIIQCAICDETFCPGCDENFVTCEGCEAPLCKEKCVLKLACGNDADLCGDCNYDCEDCDYCAGYHSGGSRWK